MFKKDEWVKNTVYVLFALFWTITIIAFVTTGVAKTIITILWIVTLIAETVFAIIYFIQNSDRKKKPKKDAWGRLKENE